MRVGRFGLYLGVIAITACGNRDVQPSGAAVDQPSHTESIQVDQPSHTESIEQAPPPQPISRESTIAAPRSVRIVVQSAHELLGSELRTVERIEQALDEHRFDAVIAPPDEVEINAARSWFSGNPPTELPSAWRAVETIMVIALVPPQAQRSGRRITRGIERILILRPPSLEPIVSMRADESAGFSITREWGSWTVHLLEGLEGGDR
jgi:hypothetical protein